MPAPPNEVFSAFAFIGFLISAIPFYWHFEGTRTYFRRCSTHSEDIRHSWEYRHLLVYGLDWHWMPDRIHQLGCVE